ncbi:MAG: hypothetical protein HOV80_17750 [Polyangiaceae bacterium]|nr:hypothetical protein [Polyangiaceae bacterium]
MGQHVIPNGKAKGTPLADADDKDIRYWFDRMAAENEAEPDGRYAARNRDWLREASQVFVSRGADPADYAQYLEGTGGGAPGSDRGGQAKPSGDAARGGPTNGNGAARENGRPPTTNGRAAPKFTGGTFHDPEELKAQLAEWEKHYIIIGGASVGEIPEGHSIMASIIKVDPTVNGTTYSVAGGLALTKPSINDLADAAGVTDVYSQMLFYDPGGACAFKVRVARQTLSGAVVSREGTRIVDLRKGSKEYRQMLAKGQARQTKARAEKWKSIPDPEGQINEILLHLPAHAASKARLIAIRNLLSLRTYSDTELRTKSFIVLKLAFTGRSHDPKLRMMFAHGLMQAALGGNFALFGAGPQHQQQAAALPMGAPPPLQLTGAPPAVHLDDDVDDHESDDDGYGLGGDDVPY